MWLRKPEYSKRRHVSSLSILKPYFKRLQLAAADRLWKELHPGLRGWDTLPTFWALDRQVDTQALLAELRRRPYKQGKELLVDFFQSLLQRPVPILCHHFVTRFPGA